MSDEEEYERWVQDALIIILATILRAYKERVK